MERINARRQAGITGGGVGSAGHCVVLVVDGHEPGGVGAVVAL
jgi:hypothetical protein